MLPVKLKLLEGGYCTHFEAVAIKGGKWCTCQFAALFGHIEHPTRGNILYDTGYTERMYEETRTFPFKLYALTTPVYVEPGVEARAQLLQRNVTAESIQYIFISHFHADHIAGLKDFPLAKFICFKSAYDAVKDRQGLKACLKGFIPALLPENFLERVLFVEDQPLITLDQQFLPFTQGFDVFGDKSLIAVNLSGHTEGQMGLILTKSDGQIAFLVADACWYSEAYREYRLPHGITRIIHFNHKGYQQTLQKLHELYQHNKELQIIPSHCPEIRALVNEGVL